jgi:hypothetical protein
MPSIDETWLRRAFGAMSEMLDVDTRTRDQMIQFLIDEGFWPEGNFKDFNSAIARWNSCKRSNTSEFFKMGELWALALRFGRHHLFAAIMVDLGYETPRLRPTEERRQELIERSIAVQEQCMQAMQDIQGQLARLEPFDTKANRLNGAGRPHFSLSAESTIPATPVERIGAP